MNVRTTEAPLIDGPASTRAAQQRIRSPYRRMRENTAGLRLVPTPTAAQRAVGPARPFSAMWMLALGLVTALALLIWL